MISKGFRLIFFKSTMICTRVSFAELIRCQKGCKKGGFSFQDFRYPTPPTQTGQVQYLAEENEMTPSLLLLINLYCCPHYKLCKERDKSCSSVDIASCLQLAALSQSYIASPVFCQHGAAGFRQVCYLANSSKHWEEAEKGEEEDCGGCFNISDDS